MSRGPPGSFATPITADKTTSQAILTSAREIIASIIRWQVSRGVPLPNPALDFLSASAPRDSKIIICLQIEPQFRRHAEVGAQAQRRISSDGARAIDDEADPVGRNVQIPRQSVDTDAHGLQEIFQQNLARVN